jgi:hypothetical protein
MAHQFFGFQAAEDAHLAHRYDHDQIHEDTRRAERAAGVWLFITMVGGRVVWAGGRLVP